MNPARRPAILLLLLLSVGAVGEETWRFITLADWHQAEKYTQSRKNPEWLPEAIAKDIANTRMLKEKFGGELTGLAYCFFALKILPNADFTFDVDQLKVLER